MLFDMNPRSLKHGTVTITDLTPTSVVVDGEEGGVQFQIPRSARAVKHRGTIQGWASQPDEPISGSLSLGYGTFYSDTGDSETATPYEALTQSGEAAAYLTVNTIDDSVYSVDLVLEIANPITGKKKEKITLANVRVSNVNFAEGEESNELSFDFEAVSISIERLV